jgi:hypothetical protein
MVLEVAERTRVCQWIEWMGFCAGARPPPDDPEELRYAIMETVKCLSGSALQCTFCIVAALALPRERERERESKH